MSAVTVVDAKTHLRVEDAAEDDMIEAYLDASVDYLASIGVDMQADPLPAAIRAAVLIHVTHLFENRGAGTSVPADRTWERLVAPYRTQSV